MTTRRKNKRQRKRRPEAYTKAEKQRRQKPAEGRKANSRQGGNNDQETAEPKAANRQRPS